MHKTVKSIIVILISLLAVLAIYYGSYLPLTKSQMYIDSMLALQNGKIKSVADFENTFKPALDYYSPVGQDETTSAFLGVALNVSAQQQNKQIEDALVKITEDIASPSINNSLKGFNYGQAIYTLGLLYSSEGSKFNDPVYLQKGIQTFNKGLVFSPKRPAYLYGLFDLYSSMGNKEKAREVGKTILGYWPGDEQVKDYLTNNL